MPARGNTSQIAQRFDCLAVTLEMPFKDTVNVQFDLLVKIIIILLGLYYHLYSGPSFHRFGANPSTMTLVARGNQDNVPDPEVGWSPPRCLNMGAAMLNALARVLPHLRSPDPPAELTPASL